MEERVFSRTYNINIQRKFEEALKAEKLEEAYKILEELPPSPDKADPLYSTQEILEKYIERAIVVEEGLRAIVKAYIKPEEEPEEELEEEDGLESVLKALP